MALWFFRVYCVFSVCTARVFIHSFQVPPPSFLPQRTDGSISINAASKKTCNAKHISVTLNLKVALSNVFHHHDTIRENFKQKAIVLPCDKPETAIDDSGDGIGGQIPPNGGSGDNRRPWRDDNDGNNNDEWAWINFFPGCIVWSVLTPLIFKTKIAHADTTPSLQNTSKLSMFDGFTQMLNRLNPFSGSKNVTEEEKQMEKLRKTIVRKVIIKDDQTSAIPQEILDQYATRAGLIGANLTPGPVQELARLLKQYYQSHGYVLSGMTGATLIAPDENDNDDSDDGNRDSDVTEATNKKTPLSGQGGIVEISVEEPIMASKEINGETPVAIAFAKKMVIDPNTGQTRSLREYKKKLSAIELSTLNVNTLNSTYVQTTGKTRTSVVSSALGLEGGEKFQWKDKNWEAIQSSDIFYEILQAEPVKLDDGTIQFRMICRERPVRNIEYGISKSLFNNKWEGELGLEYGNTFGGGETLELSVRRAATTNMDGEFSYRVSYKDQEFCTPSNGKRGWSFEAFNEHIGTGKSKSEVGETNFSSKAKEESIEGTVDNISGTDISDTDLVEETTQTNSDEVPAVQHSAPSIRNGLSYSVSHPFRDWFHIQQSEAQLSAEQVLCSNGKKQNIISSFWSAGPFIAQLPRDGRHSINMSFGVGSTLGNDGEESMPNEGEEASNAILTTNTALSLPLHWKGGDQKNLASHKASGVLDTISKNTLPYGHVTATARQIIPILHPKETNSPTVLALKHSVSTCSSSIPFHRAVVNAANIRVRGYNSASGTTPSSAISYQTSVLGTTEIRIPLDNRKSYKNQLVKTVLDDSSITLFAEWLFAHKLDPSARDVARPLIRQSSVGIGLRKTIQGIPIKYDLSLTEEGKLGASVNFGRDFDVY